MLLLSGPLPHLPLTTLIIPQQDPPIQTSVSTHTPLTHSCAQAPRTQTHSCTRTLGANHRHGNSNQQKLSFPYYSEDMTVSLSFLLPSLEYDCFFSFPPSFPSSLSRSVFFFISYHTHHSVSLLPGSYSVILIITTVQEDNIYIQFRLFLIRKKVGARLGRVQFKPKYWQVKDTFSFLTDPNLNPHVPVLVSAKVLSHPRNTRWKKKKVGLVRIS